MVHNKSRLYCTIDRNERGIFFSLVDYRNNYFISDNPDKIIEFYNSFENRDQLIQWMKERPKGICTIHEVEGDKDVIVVIPAADFNGKYAKECRENTFKGLHMVFVESGVGNYYFNYAHNCNVGIKKAMEYNPKWIVISNDDMYKIDEVEVLRKELLSLKEEEIDVVFTKTSMYHSRDVIFSRRTLIRRLILTLLSKTDRLRLKLERRYSIEIIVGSTSGFVKFIYKPLLVVKYTGSFGIFSFKFLAESHGELFDEVYLNGSEDLDLALRIHSYKNKKTEIDYSIGDIIGGTIGSYNSIRRIRGFLNDCYFNYKFSGLIINGSHNILR